MNEQPLEALGLNLKMIQDSPNAWSINKSLAFKLSFNSMITVGDFFQTLSNDDLVTLVAATEKMFYGDPANPDLETETEMLLLTLLLSVGEGLEIVDDADQLINRCQSLVSLIALESLSRRGFVQVKHENMSLGQDTMDLEVAAMTPEGQNFITNFMGQNKPD